MRLEDPVGRNSGKQTKGKQHIGIAEGIIGAFCRRRTRNLHTLQSLLLEVECTLILFSTRHFSEQRKEFQTLETLVKPLVLHPGSMCKQYAHTTYFTQSLEVRGLEVIKTQMSFYKKSHFPLLDVKSNILVLENCLYLLQAEG